MRNLAILLAALLLAACNNAKRTMQPDSGGRPYEVILVGDRDSILYNVLTHPMEALPQAEPTFDVSLKDSLNATLRLARNIVIVDIDKRKERIEVKYMYDRYAEPQLVVRICSPSAAMLKHDLQQKQNADALRAILQRHETDIAVARLKRKHNPKLEEDIQRMFGIGMYIPADMKASRKGKDFIWISNDSPTMMRNICIYTSENRDSVMKANIKGETDDMYMTTTPGTVTEKETLIGNRTTTIRRGLWEMSGDAMGGPFVQHIIKQDGKRQTIVAEVFVYAPGTKKRNVLLNTEAALYTIESKQQTKDGK